MPIKIVFLLTLILSCSTPRIEEPRKPHAPKEFSRAELINGTQLLTKIFDMEISPLPCVPDTDEASLLLRTIRPRMEVVEDDLEAMLDDPKEVNNLINTCDQSCVCDYIDDLLREHLVTLSKKQRKILNDKKASPTSNACLVKTQQDFCQSELYQELNKEKADFSFDEEAP